jgi:hypothetical protein
MAGNTTPPLPVILVAHHAPHAEVRRLPPEETLAAAKEAALRAGYEVHEEDAVESMADWGGTPAHVVAVHVRG